MLSRLLTALLVLGAAALRAQTSTTTTPSVILDVRTVEAQCNAIARSTACLRYTQPPFPQTVGVKTPEFAIIRVTGPDNASVIQAVVVSPGGRQWLRVRRAGAPVGGVSITDQLPQDVEIYLDEAQALEMRSGRFLATLVVTVAGVSAPAKLPVQLTIDPDVDSVVASPDFIPDLTVNATQNPQPLRYSIHAQRTGVGPPFQVSVTPETSDGGNWLGADMQVGFSPCTTSAVPCDFDAIVTPPSTAGDYWGALVISSGGTGYADRVAVRVRVNPEAGVNPPTIEPRQVTLSAPLGATALVTAQVQLKGGYDGLAFRAVEASSWLTVDPPSTHWPAVLKLTANPTGLDVGLYTESVELRTVDTGELLATIPVNFTITAPIYLPALSDGGGWRSTIYLVNPGAAAIKATMRFWTTPRDSAQPWLLGLAGRGLTTTIENEIIPPLGMRVIETLGTQANRQQGWAEIVADGPVVAHAVLSESRAAPPAGRAITVEAAEPMGSAFRDRLLLPFNNLDDASASLFLANPEDAAITASVVVLNEDGAELAKEGNLTLGARGAAAFELKQKWPSTANRRGLVALEFDGRRMLAAGMRAIGLGFHFYPAVARGELGAERGFARVTAGGAGTWQSTGYFTNASSLAQTGALRLWPDTSRAPDSGLRSESALPVPADGALVWESPPGSDNPGEAPDSGWLESRYPKQVGGYLLMRQSVASGRASTSTSWESAITGQNGANARIAIPFDYRGAAMTQIVLVNTNDDPTEIQPVIYDLAGRFPRFGETFKLPGKGQLFINGADRWELGGQQGILVFSSRNSYRLSGVGMRAGGDGPVAILPAYEK